jgi:NDP-sugar pyrophosphorylase family protein
MEGSRITMHTERPEHPTTHLIKTMISIMSPEIFEFIPTGSVHYTLEHQVIPELIKERQCLGYLVSGDWFNIHSSEDLRQLKNFLKDK